MSNSKKSRREELFVQLNCTQKAIEHLQCFSIPKILKELKELKPTKKEIKENNLKKKRAWNSLNDGKSF